MSAVIALAGCDGDGGGKQPEVSSGNLRAGGVQGLSYATSTQAGVTDANGTFHYVAGETVHFHIGGVHLGSATGAPELTLFTLAGLSPPMTERALRGELDRASRRSTPFLGAVNRQRLLIALDADHDPRNGYDLRGRAAELVGASLSFDRPSSDFARRLDRLSPRLTRQIPYAAPVAELYRGVGISVSVREEVRRDITSGGNHLQSAVREYTPEGLLFRASTDLDDDGAPEIWTEVSFDRLGRALSVSAHREGWFMPASSNQTLTRDSRGNVVRARTENDFDNDGQIDVVLLTAATLDSHDRLASGVTEEDSNLDGVPDSRVLQEITYDSRGNPTVTTYRTDTDLDGVDENLQTYQVTFDSLDRPVEQTYEHDEDGDGVIDARHVSTGTWSADSRVFVAVESADFDGDGVTEQIVERRYEIDASGTTRRVVLASYSTADDGSSGFEQEEIFDMDAEGRTVLQTSEYRYGGGIGTSRTRTTMSYDDVGNLLDRITERDDLADGETDGRTTEAYTYGAGGELLESSYADDSSWIGGPPSPALTTVTNETFTSGVALLAQKYFGGGGAVTPLALSAAGP